MLLGGRAGHIFLKAWVASGPARQPDAAAGALAKVEDAPIINEGGQDDPAPAQAPQQPPPSPSPAPARTMVHRLGRLEEDVQGLHQDIRSLRGLAFDGSFRGSSPAAFERRTRQRTGEANTSTAQQGPQHPYP
ncbi:hypothetical protein Tco_0021964 [Tanacetum coccineum]